MKVCVVGSGPSGLTTIKQLIDEGHDVVCFEKNADVGGIWLRCDDDEDEMKVFDSLILTISMKLMSFSDFMVEGERVFYTHKQYHRYLSAYADKFALRQHIRFQSTVNEIQSRSNGEWCVTVTSNGIQATEVFDAVAICVGPFQKPNTNIAELEGFSGEVIHSYRYRNNQHFKNKKVLVVGLAESGADILREISNVASACALCIRSYSYLFPRLLNGVHSTDGSTARSLHYEILLRATGVPYPMRGIFGDSWIARRTFSLFSAVYGIGAGLVNAVHNLFQREELGETNNLGEPMLPKKIDVETEWTRENVSAIDEWNRRSHHNKGNWTQKVIFSKNVSFIPNIVNGKIRVHDNGVRYSRGNRVYFNDNTADEFDAIVLCTGFVKDFSCLNGIVVPDNNVRNLYKHAFHPDYNGRLAFIGFVRPFSGGIPICAEMQARYFALLCSDKIKLPHNVRQRITREKEWEERATMLSPRHTESIPSQAFFLDSIAREIGCLMKISQLVIKPRLLVRHWFYPFNQACYRLVGPHSSRDIALKEIMNDKPSFIGQGQRILGLIVLSILPRFIHPKNVLLASGPSTNESREHFLRPRSTSLPLQEVGDR